MPQQSLLKSGPGFLPEISRKIKQHDHIGLLYSSQDEQLSIAAEYIKVGLEQKEKCVYVIDETSPETLISEIKKTGIDIETAISEGDFLIADKDDIYLKKGYFDPDSMIKYIKELTDITEKEGYKNLRASGEMSWALNSARGSEKLMEYEAKLNIFAPRYNITLLCQFDLGRFDSRRIVQSIQTHPAVIYKKEICDSTYFIPPAEFLQNDNADDVKNRMLENIYQRKKLDSEISNGADIARINNKVLEQKVSEREKALKVFKESESYFRNLINAAPVAIILTDTNGRCLFANNHWQILSGLSLQKSIGAGWQKLIHPDYVGKIGMWWYRGEKKDTDPGTECRIRTAAGEDKWIDFKSSPLTAEHGGLIGYISSLTDITYRKEYEFNMLKRILAHKHIEESGDNGEKLIPICSCCKKIRDVQGEWIDAEEFISSLSPVRFSHGFCPDCKEDVCAGIQSLRTSNV